MSKISTLFGGRRRADGYAGVLMQFAQEVVERRRSIQGAINEVRHPSVLDALSDEDFRVLGEAIEEAAPVNIEFAMALARLTHAAARAKGFDRQIVDAALRLDSLLPPTDQSRERDQLLRDAYTIARRCGYARGGRTALSRLGQRSAVRGDIDRARKLLMQQLEISEESADSIDDIDSALLLGDLMLREGDSLVAQAFYRRAQRSAQRLDYQYGLAESLSRQVELLDPQAAPEVIAEMQRMALNAARATGDIELQSRVVLDLAATMERSGRFDDAVILFGQAVEFAREIGDFQAEIESLLSLEGIERRRKRWEPLARHQRDLLLVEERQGNRTGAASWAIELGVTLLEVGQVGAATEAFRRGLTNAQAVADPLLSQRALGGIGATELAQKRVPEGIDALMQALALARAHDDPVHEAKWLSEIAQALSKFGYNEDALRNATDGLAVARRIDDAALQVSLLGLTGKLQQQLGQLTRARESYTKALDLARKVDLPAETMRMLASLGNMALNVRQWAQAATLFTQALQVSDQIGDRVMASRLHGRLGQIAQEQRDPLGSMEHYRRAAESAELGDDQVVMQRALANLAAAQHRTDDPVAGNTYRRALNLAQQLGDKREEAVLRLNLGTYLADQGQVQEALEHLYAAAALARGFGDGEEIHRRATEMAERLDEGTTRGAGPQAWGSYAGSGAATAPPPPAGGGRPPGRGSGGSGRGGSEPTGYGAGGPESGGRGRGGGASSRARDIGGDYPAQGGGYDASAYGEPRDRSGHAAAGYGRYGAEPDYARGGYGAPPSPPRGEYGEQPYAAQPQVQAWDQTEGAGGWGEPIAARGGAPRGGYAAPVDYPLEPDYPPEYDDPYGYVDEMFGEETLPPE